MSAPDVRPDDEPAKNCLHCDKRLVDRKWGKLSKYCNVTCANAFYCEKRRRLDNLNGIALGCMRKLLGLHDDPERKPVDIQETMEVAFAAIKGFDEKYGA